MINTSRASLPTSVPLPSNRYRMTTHSQEAQAGAYSIQPDSKRHRGSSERITNGQPEGGQLSHAIGANQISGYHGKQAIRAERN